MVNAKIADEGFIPCRDNRCDLADDGVHPAHDLDKPRNNFPPCPLCGNDLIKLRKTRMRCASCQWRGMLAEAKLGDKNA